MRLPALTRLLCATVALAAGIHDAAAQSRGMATSPSKAVTMPMAKAAAPAAPADPLKITVGGRIQADTRYHLYPDESFLGENNHLDWFQFRRVRLDVKAKYQKALSGKISVELTETPYIKNAYIDTKLGDSATVELGKFTPAFNPEDVESSKYLTFLERSSVGKALSSGDDHGVDFFGTTLFGYLDYHLGLVTGAVDQDSDNNNSLDWISRLVVHPTVDGDDFFQLWLGTSFQAGSQTTIEGDGIKIKPESQSGLSLFKASFDPDLEYSRYKLEFDATMLVGPTVFRAAYLWSDYEFDKSATISGGYLSGSVFLTGEQRIIEGGYNERQEVDSPLGDDGFGAWELALRYSWFDVADAFFQTDGLFSGWEGVSAEKYANRGSAITLGVNWYPNDRFRLMTNWVTTFADHTKVDGDTVQGESVVAENAFLMRFQFEF